MSDHDQEKTQNKKSQSNLFMIIELIFGLFGIFGIGHLFCKRWVSGIIFVLFSFIFSVFIGIIKDVILHGNYPPGTFALCIRVPVVFVSVLILNKQASK